MKRLYFSPIMICLFLISTYISAQPKVDFNRGPKLFDGPRINTQLNLTDEQSSKYNEIKYNHRKSIVDINAEIKKNKIEIRKMMDDKNVDSEKLLKLITEDNELHGKMKILNTKMWLDVYNILNDDQKSIWIKHFDQNRQMKKNNRFRRDNCILGDGPGFGRKNKRF